MPSRSLTGGLAPASWSRPSSSSAHASAPSRSGSPRRTIGNEGHTRRVALRAVLVGEEPRLPPNRLRSLATGGLLHDIGKLSVPDEILTKPGASTRTSSQSSSGILEWGHAPRRASRLLRPVRRLVLDHHERLDGTGYPHGRTVPTDLETRILTVCDVYDAPSPSASTAVRGRTTRRSACSASRPARPSTPAASQPSSACSHETHSSSAWQSRRLVLRLRASRRVRERMRKRSAQRVIPLRFSPRLLQLEGTGLGTQRGVRRSRGEVDPGEIASDAEPRTRTPATRTAASTRSTTG